MSSGLKGSISNKNIFIQVFVVAMAQILYSFFYTSSSSLTNTRPNLVSATGGDEELLLQDQERHSGRSGMVSVWVSHFFFFISGGNPFFEKEFCYLRFWLDSLIILSRE